MLPRPLPPHDLLSLAIHSFIDISGVLANGYLLLALIYRAPLSLGSYKIIIFNMVFIEFASCVCSFLVMVRLIPSGTIIGYAFLGPCTILSTFFCHFAYVTVLHACAHSLYLCLLSLYYRLHVIQRSAPSRLFTTVMCIIIYLPSLAAMLSSLFTFSPNDEALPALALARPEYDLIDYDLTVHLDIRDPFVMFTVLFMTLPAAPAAIAALVLRQKVITVLRRAVLSPNSLKMHQSLIKASFLPYLCRGTHRLIVEFVQALTLQCLLPAFFFLGILCYALCTFEITHSPAIEHAILGFLAVGPAISPMISIAHIRPFREFVQHSLNDLLSRSLGINISVVTSALSSKHTLR